MNKSFVKEDSASDSEALPTGSEMDAALDQELFGTGGAPKNYITPKGFAELQKSLHQLVLEERPQYSDLASGPESLDPEDQNFQNAKARLEDIDRRIRLLQRRIDLAEVIDPQSQSGDRVLFGATVTVLDDNEQTRVYKIVGVDETNGKLGKVSWVSPIGRALLQAQVGDTVLLETPSGEEELEILKIEYKTID